MLSAKSLQFCPTLWDPSLKGSSVHGISQARILEWVAVSSSRGSSWPRDWARASYIAGRLFIVWATKKAPGPHQMETGQDSWITTRSKANSLINNLPKINSSNNLFAGRPSHKAESRLGFSSGFSEAVASALSCDVMQTLLSLNVSFLWIHILNVQDVWKSTSFI